MAEKGLVELSEMADAASAMRCWKTGWKGAHLGMVGCRRLRLGRKNKSRGARSDGKSRAKTGAE